MKIAIASSGLGHVARGIETWARDTAQALAERGVDVTLFAAGAVPGVRCPVSVLPSLRRGAERAKRLAARGPGWIWRWQLKSPYGWEQLSFWRRLWPHLRRGRFDILHVQDPMLAYWCRLFRKRGLVRTREILAHGTEESFAFLRRFDYVQHLAPWHEEQVSGVRGQGAGGARRLWVAIPNFVDTSLFRPPADTGERAASRAEAGIPTDALVVGTVAAVKKHHKRMDYLIREFAAMPSRAADGRDAYLLIAGARTDQSDELVRLAASLAPGRVRFLFDLARARMPALYRSMDVFVLASEFEMMPIALLEALACGLPAIVNRHPVLEWMIGEGQDGAEPGGLAIAMAAPGALQRCLCSLDGERLARWSRCARDRAVRVFSTPVVVGEYVRYYARVAEGNRIAGRRAGAWEGREL